jgi:ABC-2 type transport system ATP-binding protein
MIKVQGLTFDYPGHRALDNVNFELAAGSVTALVGANGAGKTTLLRCLAGLDTPLSGSVAIATRDVLAEPRIAHRNIGYLSDFFGLYQELTVAQCLRYAAAAQCLPASDIPAAIARTAAQLNLTAHLEQLAGSLSRGQRQRVAIGQAIIHRPQVLLLDEPASGLDPEARASLAILFKQLQADGMTLLVSSHILAELDEYSTHLLALRDGKILDYRALQNSVHHDTARALEVQLAVANSELASWLSARTNLTLLSAAANTASFEFIGDAHAQAALLKELIKANFIVSSYTERAENLQQSYLRSVAAHLENPT